LEVEQDAASQQFFFGKPGAEFNLDYEFSSTYLAALPHARLVGPAYVVVSHDRQVIDESYSGDSILQSGGHFLKRTLKVELDGQDRRRVEGLLPKPGSGARLTGGERFGASTGQAPRWPT
jgi:hypothetical protein